MPASEIAFICSMLDRASSFVDVFGELPEKASVEEQHAYLRMKYTQLARSTHPDRVEDLVKDKAARLFNRITELRHAADAAIASGTYSKKFSAVSVDLPPSNPAAFTSVRSAYFLISDDPVYIGEHSVIYGATSANKEDVLLRIVNSPMYNPWFAEESKFIKLAFDGKSGFFKKSIRRYFPEILDTFIISGDNDTRYHAYVYPRKRGMVSIRELGEKHAHKLDIQHIAWISRRIMAQACAAAVAGRVHGAITPDHVLVDPVSREPLHIGWQHSVLLGQPSKIRPKNFEEILNSCGISEERDDTQAAINTILWLRSKLPKHEEFPAKIENIFEHKGIHKKYGLIPAVDILAEMTKEYHHKWGVNYRPIDI